MNKKTLRILLCTFSIFTYSISNSQWLQTNGPYGGFRRCLVVSGTYIFAGTYGGGVWKRPLSEIVGIGELHKNIDIDVYPNPASDKFTIEIPQISPNCFFFLFNQCGQEILHKPVSKHPIQIDISALPQGIYFVKVENDKTVQLGKVLKR
jgi:hypothetical protein